MSKVKRIFIALLIISIFCCTGLEAYAATESQDGLSVTLTTDKQSYLPGEAINVSLLLTNGNSFPISSVHAQVSAPEGYILAAGYAESMGTASLGAGKSLQLAIRYLEQNSVPVPLPTLGPDRVGVATGDQANLPLWIALAVVSLAALMLLALRKKIWKRFFCLLLCFVMLGGIAGPVYAANDQVQKTIRIATPVKVGNRDLTVQGVVSYTMGSEVSPSPTPTTVPSPTPTAQPSPTPAPTPTPVPGEYFTVSYQLNYEGAGEYLSQQVEKGSCAQEPSRPSREGHTFMGWYTEPGCVNRYLFSSPINGNCTLYAKWEENVVPENADIFIDNNLYISVPDEAEISKDEETGIEFANNELLVFAELNASREDVLEYLASMGGMVVGEISATNTYQVKFSATFSLAEIEALQETLEASPLVSWTSIDFVCKMAPTYYPYSDTEWSNDWGDSQPNGKNWGVEAIHAPEAWDYREQMSYINVGVIDGCFNDHADLVYTEKYLSNTQSVGTHGTHVSGTIAAGFDNDTGISGVAPYVNLYVFPLSSVAMSDKDLYSKLLLGLTALIHNDKCRVVNASIGVDYEFQYDNSGIIEYVPAALLVAKGISEAGLLIQNSADEMGKYLNRLLEIGNDFVICNSAGNENDKGYTVDSFYNSYFSAIDDLEVKNHVIVVGACKNNGDGTYTYSNFSNVGDRVDVVAPGENIWSTIRNNRYGNMDGTSMASPHVAGVAAMLYSLDPTLTGPEVKRIIVETAKTDVQGFNKNMVDAEAAVKAAERGVFYGDSILATITDGTTPLKDAYAVISYSSDGTAGNSTTQIVPAAENGFFYYKMPEGVEQMTLSFHCKGYNDYEYPEIVYADRFYDLGEIVLEAKLVPDTVEARTYLKDADTGTAIAGAQAQAFSGSGEIPVAVAASDDTGYLCIELPENTLCTLKISCEGYNSRELDLQLEEPLWFGENGTGLGEADGVLYLQKAGAFEGFAGGDGSMNNPYQIANAKQLNAIRDGLSAHYVLIDDIDLSAYSPWVPIGTETTPFTGSLNGDDHTISNLTFNNLSVSKWMETNGGRSQNAFIGLFGFVQDALLTALALENVNTEITDNAAVSVGTMYYGSICGWTNNWVDYCTASGSINISMEKASFVHAGGLVGYATGSQAQIDNNVNSASLTIRGGGIVCGGVVGTNDGKIFFCQNYGEINCRNTNGPDLLCGGVVGNAFNSNVARCRNFGDITSKTEGWGWPSSGNYRHQTGGVVGLFQGASSSENTLSINYCENSGNINVTSFTGYNIANSCCENDSTGGICGGFVCLSSSKWYGEIINCINYATSIHAQRVKNVDGTLEYTDSPTVGRIGGYETTPYYSYSNNTSDPATLLNGAVCTENIGAETKNGTNQGEENTEDENGTLNISVLEGTWSNGLPEDNYSGFYLTEFGSDGTVVQKGYRNIDKGRFEITGANTAVATFDDNYYDTSGVGYQKIADYSYTVTYTYDKYSDTLLADYSDVFENAANSNACDGTLSRWSGTPLHEQIKDIVLGTQEDDTQEQKPQDYQSFLTSQAYLDYAEGWNSSGETYAILDINQDGVDELIVNSPNDFGFMYSLIFTKNYEGQIVRLANEYHYGYIRYSAEHSAIEYSELNPTHDLGSGEFYAMSGAGLALIFSISWDNSEGTENSQIYYPSSGESVPISGEERQAYFASLQNLNWVSLT